MTDTSSPSMRDPTTRVVECIRCGHGYAVTIREYVEGEWTRLCPVCQDRRVDDGEGQGRSLRIHVPRTACGLDHE
jgi:hypothetical protein